MPSQQNCHNDFWVLFPHVRALPAPPRPVRPSGDADRVSAPPSAMTRRGVAALAAAARRLRGSACVPLKPLAALQRPGSRWLTSGTPLKDAVVGCPKESFAGERRVALTPHSVAALVKAGVKTVLVESGAGAAAKFTDAGALARATRLRRQPAASHAAR